MDFIRQLLQRHIFHKKNMAYSDKISPTIRVNEEIAHEKNRNIDIGTKSFAGRINIINDATPIQLQKMSLAMALSFAKR